MNEKGASMRIDKLLANKDFGSRKEVHDLIKKGLVTINGKVVKKKDEHCDPETDMITVNGEEISTQLTYYIKFNKPAGYVTAVDDTTHPTVMELLPPEFMKLEVYPVGRLDKDTEGLLLLTNDGPWAHRMIHGKKTVGKTYEVHYTGELSDDGLRRIEMGMTLGDGTELKPAQLEIVEEGLCYLTIQEGKFHQVKRMIAAAGGEVTYLKRLSIGHITLEHIEETGMYTELTEEELTQ